MVDGIKCESKLEWDEELKYPLMSVISICPVQ